MIFKKEWQLYMPRPKMIGSLAIEWIRQINDENVHVIYVYVGGGHLNEISTADKVWKEMQCHGDWGGYKCYGAGEIEL